MTVAYDIYLFAAHAADGKSWLLLLLLLMFILVTALVCLPTHKV